MQSNNLRVIKSILATINTEHSSLKSLENENLPLVDNAENLLETACTAEGQLKESLGEYISLLAEEQELQSELAALDIKQNAEKYFVQQLGCWVQTVRAEDKDAAPLYKFIFSDERWFIIQHPDNQIKLIEMQPKPLNFHAIKEFLESSQDLIGLIVALSQK